MPKKQNLESFGTIKLDSRPVYAKGSYSFPQRTIPPVAHRAISHERKNQVAFRSNRTSNGKQERLAWARMTQS